jgi:hypothetical protein
MLDDSLICQNLARKPRDPSSRQYTYSHRSLAYLFGDITVLAHTIVRDSGSQILVSSDVELRTYGLTKETL